jgi:hypothetical protein
MILTWYLIALIRFRRSLFSGESMSIVFIQPFSFYLSSKLWSSDDAWRELQ